MLQLAEKLHLARVSAGLNITEAAKKVGAKRSTYQYWEEKGPPLNELSGIIQAFHLPANYFFDADPEILQKKILPLGDLKVTLKDHFDLFQRYTSMMERLVEKNLLADGKVSSPDPKEIPANEEQDEDAQIDSNWLRGSVPGMVPNKKAENGKAEGQGKKNENRKGGKV